MAKSQAVVFDLDGTLLDSAPDIAYAINLLLQHYGYEQRLSHEQIIANVGNGAKTLIKKVWTQLNLPMQNEAQLDAALAQFQQLYYPICSDKSRLYDGVLTTVKTLYDAGFKLAVCTNKPESHAKKIMCDYGLDKWMSFCCGGDTFAVKKPDPKPLLETIKALSCIPQNTFFIGDSEVDHKTAIAAESDFVFLSFGYHNGYQPIVAETNISDHFSDILNFILKA